MKPDQIVNKLRLDDEILSALSLGINYKPIKLSNRTLEALKERYEDLLEDCESQIESYYYNEGQVIVDVDNTLIFRYHGIDLSLFADADFDRETLGELLLTIAAVYMRIPYRKAIDQLEKTIDTNTRKATVIGLSNLAKSMLEDTRFSASQMDGVDFDDDETETITFEDDEDLEDEEVE